MVPGLHVRLYPDDLHVRLHPDLLLAVHKDHGQLARLLERDPRARLELDELHEHLYKKLDLKLQHF